MKLSTISISILIPLTAMTAMAAMAWTNPNCAKLAQGLNTCTAIYRNAAIAEDLGPKVLQAYKHKHKDILQACDQVLSVDWESKLPQCFRNEDEENE